MTKPEQEQAKEKSRVVFVLQRPRFILIVLILLAVSTKVRVHDYLCQECDTTWSEAELRLVVWPLFVVWKSDGTLSTGKAAPVVDHPAHKPQLSAFRDYGLSSLWQ